MSAIIFIVVAAGIAVPVAIVALVSMASRREDHAWTLTGPAPGRLEAAARRIVGFHSEGLDWTSQFDDQRRTAAVATR